MNPVVSNDSSGFAHKDAVFFSMHKFLGGVQTPGVLIAKKHLFENPVPEVCGGGTVFFVSRDTHRYLQDIETREEGGTPAVVEAIRAGLVMQLKDNITAEYIMNRNNLLTRKLAKITNDIPELVPLGSMNFENRLPVLSFVVRHATSGLFLHHNFISAVLNDLYGIQSRGGCACAGPYAQDLLGINEDLAQRYEKLLVEDIRLDRSHLRRHQEHSDVEILRPGFVRLNLPYSASDKQIEFILDALQEVCTRGWSLLPQYNFNPETGEWKHYTNLVFKERQWLQNISYSSGMFSYGKKDKLDEIPCYSECLQNAKVVIEQAAKAAQRRHIPDETILFNNEAAELRWFMLPSEGKFYLQQQLPTSLGIKKSLCLPPFTPPTYPLSEDQLKQRLDFVWERKTTPINRTSMAGILQRTATTSCSVSESCSEKMLDGIYDPNDTVVKIHDRINVSNDTVVKSDQNVLHSSDDVSKLAVLNIDEKTRVLTESTQKLTSGKGKLTDTELKNECFNKSKVKTVICEDLKCFVKRNVSKPCQKFAEYHKWYSPPKNIFNSAVEALQEYDMIKHNDRVLVCLSGGKDSLSLLHVLRQYQYYAKARGIYFTLGAVTVDPMSASYDPRPLIPYLSSLGVPYIFEQQDILKQAAELENLNSICSFCSRMKRGRIYAAARREGYNVLAFGQHLDDLAESFFMSVFHNGRLRTMKAHYIVKEEDLRVIRPFIYVREKELRIFAESKKLPVIPENCPACFEAPKERHRVKQMLAQQEVLFPGLFWSLRTALHPVMSISATGLENEMFGKSSKFCSQIKNGKLIDNIDDDDDADS
ncbi:hypothetical protein SK128_017261 [Halocaridina rubra]|uniref:tRNA 2-thiocytidine biosynthesis protein TtcA n=1 Tax=Halocaridina rubra TaxID=373956 RepID=A0AAN9AF33_HALRR